MKNKILIIGPSWVGDMMMAQVLFQLLHQQYPNGELHVLAPAWCEPLLSRMPEVQKSMVLPFGHGELQLRARYQFAKSLRAEKYTQAIVLPNSWKSALIPFWANIPVRTGWVGECRYGLLNDARKLDKKKYATMAQRFAALAFAREDVALTNLPAPNLLLDKEAIDAAIDQFQLHASLQKPILALCPGAEFGPSKCWPLEYYAEVANQKIDSGWSVWIFGSSKDAAIAEQIQLQTQSRCINLTGKTNLSEAIDLLSLAKCVVTNDSGLMHVSAAVGCHVVAIYGSTSPHFTPPMTNKAIILKTDLTCQPCFQRECPLKHHHCMKQVKPTAVLKVL
jgi:heptosyltransferase-2